MMNFGALDIGSNSIRILIGRIEEGRLCCHYYGMESTRLGAGLKSSGRLSADGRARSLQVLKQYRQILDSLKVNQCRAVATAAVREAADGGEFIRMASAALGRQIEIISGQEEAELSYQGVVSGLPAIYCPLVLDIGGGSSELIWEENRVIRAFSIPLGAVKIAEDAARLRELEEWSELWTQLHSRSAQDLVVVGGTATTLAAIDLGLAKYQPELVQGYRLTRERIRAIANCLAEMPLPERRQVPGLQPERADIILAGIELLLALMDWTKQAAIIVAESDLLHALIWRQAESVEASRLISTHPGEGENLCTKLV